MKTASYFFLATVIMASINCSPATNTTTENANADARASSDAVVISDPQAANQTANQSASQPVTPETQREKDSVDALVKDLYKQHDARKSPFFQTKNRALVDKYFEKNLADLIWNDANESAGEVGALGFDPLYNAQDTDIKNFAVASPAINGDKGSVAVSFENYKAKQTIVYTLARQNSAWKISDLDYGDGMTLVGIFKEHDSHASDRKITSGEFEGIYQVGDTTCAVKSAEVRFEVKWKQGAGTEMFFADERGGGDKITFSSDPKKGKQNVFSFDNEEYNVGTFYRADDKEFPIKRIK